VTEDRWIACQTLDNIHFGLGPGGELEVESTICNEIRGSLEEVVIDNVAEDGIYCGHHTPAQYGFQSYISVPITLPDGSFFGTLCAIDPQPARLKNPETVGMFRLFAQLIAFHVDAARKLRDGESVISVQRREAILREQFIAILGHDMRNPVASVGAGAALLLKRPIDEQSKRIVRLIQGSVHRMTGLIENVMDFARGRMGNGISAERSADEALKPVLELVIEEIRAVHPGQVIVCHLDFEDPIYCDCQRIGQMLSNLLANAMSHGDVGKSIQVAAMTMDGEFELSVFNAGAIPESSIRHLFEPFERGDSRSKGLGLGLYISSQIATAHGGTLAAASSDGVTAFTFKMPLRPFP
jgi:signal transduction histidine kinase